MITVGIITASDRASRGEYDDKAGPALRQTCEAQNWLVVSQTIVPDEKSSISGKILELSPQCSLILVTGGTGISERDVTVEAIRSLSLKELPGFGEVMRAKSFERFPHAILSRAMAAAVGQSLVICLPGNPKGAVECLDFVAAAIPHAVDLLRGEATH
jgi:molybdopterin adenylyltransferase